MRRFLQHVLPRGFHKVRYFGLWHPAQRHNAARVRQMLQLHATPKFDPPPDFVLPPLAPSGAESPPSVEPLICPHCHGRLIFIRTLSPRQAMAP
jgi:Putative transposase